MKKFLANRLDHIRYFFQSKTLGLIIIGFAGIFLISITLIRIREGLYFDDSYMFIRYARNLSTYGNYGWNPHEHTFGCTNIPYTFFISGLGILRIDKLFDPAIILLLSSLFWALAALVLLCRVIYQLVGKRMDNDKWLIIVYVATLAFTPVFAFNIITGMDTMFSVFFNVLMIYNLFRFKQKQTTVRLILSAFSSYFIFLIRPDSGIYSFLIPLFIFIESKISAKIILFYFLWLLPFFVGDTLLKYMYFGNLLPLAYYVKKQGYYAGYLGNSMWNALQYSFDFILDFSFLFLVLLVFRNTNAIKKFLVFGIPLVLTLTYYFTVNQMMGFHARYYLPSMPFFITGTFYGFSTINDVKFNLRKMLLPLAYCIFIILLHFAAPIYGTYLEQKSKANAIRFEVPVSSNKLLPVRFTDYKLTLQAMEKLLHLLPDDATIAATENGFLSVKFPEIRLLDLCGLNNTEIALNGYSNEILKTWKPILIWMPANEYTSLRNQIVHSSYFYTHYDFFPGAMDYGIAVLKDVPVHDILINKMMEWYYK